MTFERSKRYKKSDPLPEIVGTCYTVHYSTGAVTEHQVIKWNPKSAIVLEPDRLLGADGPGWREARLVMGPLVFEERVRSIEDVASLLEQLADQERERAQEAMRMVVLLKHEAEEWRKKSSGQV